MTKHPFILGVACACLLVGTAGCRTSSEAPPDNVQDHGDVPPPPGSAATLPSETNTPTQ